MRAPSIWMLANLRGALLLTTSNRSEAAVGYATMDGDTAGGLAPLAGIDKTYLRAVAALDGDARARSASSRFRRSAYINAQQPTAELRPPTPAGAQTDEADLMPYDFLEAVEDSAIRDKHTPVEVLQELLPRYPAARAAAARDVDRAVLPAVVPQPVEARALRAVRSTSTIATSTRDRGAGSRSCRAASSASSPSCARTSRSGQAER